MKRIINMNLLGLRIFALIIIICFSIQTNAKKNLSIFISDSGTTMKKPIDADTIWHTFVTDTNKWNPKEIYAIYPDMQLTFKLPAEKDQSGVYNLLFQHKETGKIYLLDTINNKNERLYSRLIPGKYDVILLYANGKYIRYNYVSLEKGVNANVDMENLPIQQADSLSKLWLTLRAFNSPAGDRGMLIKNFTTNYEKKVRGYVFYEDGTAIMNRFAGVKFDGNNCIIGTLDGYIEFEINENQTVKIYSIGCLTNEIKFNVNSGLFIVLKESPYDKELEKSLFPAKLIKK